MTTPLFLLRCTEIGISIADLDLLTIGLVMDMWTEKGNDSAKYSSTVIAGQEAESWQSRRLMSLMLVWQSSLTSVKIGSCVCIIIVCWKVVCCVSCREAVYW